LHMAQLMPLPFIISYSSKSRLVLPSCFAFMVPAHLGSPGQNPESCKTVVGVAVYSAYATVSLVDNASWLWSVLCIFCALTQLVRDTMGI